MRARMRGVAALVVAVTTVIAFPVAAHAEDPVEFGGSHIVDTVGALGDREPEVAAALDDLFAGSGTDLYVAYVDSFTGTADRTQWADETMARNGFGTGDVLLAVATGDREYQLRTTQDFALTDAQLTEVQLSAIEPALRENDWAGAAIGAAQGLEASLNGEGGFNPFWLFILLVLAVGAFLFFRGRKRRGPDRVGAGPDQRQPEPVGAPAVPTAELKQRAGSALVQTDDAVRTSEQELQFAVAQYGAGSTSAFQEALDTAKAQLRKAFTLQQKLDDAVPDTEEQVRAWYGEIIDLCTAANAALDEQADAFGELRQLEKNAPAELASIRSEADGMERRIGDAQAKLSQLAGTYSEDAITTVADNDDQARARLDFARDALDEASGRLNAGDAGAAAVLLRAAEEAVDQAKLLVDAIDRLRADLDKAARSVNATIADLEADLITARGMSTRDAGSVNLPGVIAATEQAIANARSRLSAGRANPLDVVRQLDAANAQMDAVLHGVRGAQAQAQRARDVLGQVLLSAQARVSAAEDFIMARRGAVGTEARTRLVEASRLVTQAEAQANNDPATALAIAQRADSLASQAIELARDDVNGYMDDDPFGGMMGGGQRGGGMMGGGMMGRGGMMGGGSGTMGAVLGGILISSVLGGGGGMFGGGGGGMFGGGGRGGGGGFGGGFSGSGGFGGSGHRGGGGSF